MAFNMATKILFLIVSASILSIQATPLFFGGGKEENDEKQTVHVHYIHHYPNAVHIPYYVNSKNNNNGGDDDSDKGGGILNIIRKLFSDDSNGKGQQGWNSSPNHGSGPVYGPPQPSHPLKPVYGPPQTYQPPANYGPPHGSPPAYAPPQSSHPPKVAYAPHPPKAVYGSPITSYASQSQPQVSSYSQPSYAAPQSSSYDSSYSHPPPSASASYASGSSSYFPSESVSKPKPVYGSPPSQTGWSPSYRRSFDTNNDNAVVDRIRSGIENAARKVKRLFQ